MLWHLINYGLTFNLSREKIKRYPNRNKYFNFFCLWFIFFLFLVYITNGYKMYFFWERRRLDCTKSTGKMPVPLATANR